MWNLMTPLIWFGRAVYPANLNLSIGNHREASRLCLAWGCACHPTWVVPIQTRTQPICRGQNTHRTARKTSTRCEACGATSGSQLRHSLISWSKLTATDSGGYLPAATTLGVCGSAQLRGTGLPAQPPPQHPSAGAASPPRGDLQFFPCNV